MDTAGYYPKYEVLKINNQVHRSSWSLIEGRTFVIEIDKDSQAAELLKAISSVYETTRPELAEDLYEISLSLAQN